MAPLLIDSRDLLKLGFVSVLVTILVFAGGFLLGHQQAATFYQAGTDVQSLSLPEQIPVVENIADSQLPEIIEAGEEIDVDQPVTIKQSKNSSKKSMPVTTTASTSVAINSPDNKKVSAPQKSAVTEKKNAEIKIEQGRADQGKTEQGKDRLTAQIKTAGLQSSKKPASTNDNSQNEGSRAIKETVIPADASVVTTFTSDELSKIKYSIQVGMYGRLINAENMMKMLQVQQYDAYVTDYTNKKNETRYNVRLGYFADKKSALATLAKFKASQKGDGYLVRFSADNIVKIADAAAIEPAADVPAHTNETGKAAEPVILPSVITQDKISKADVLSDTHSVTRLAKTN